MHVPQSQILKKLVYATTVAVVICYSWLVARMLEPTFSVSSDVASSVFIRENDDIQFFEDAFKRFPVEAARLSEETSSIANKFSLLGPLKTSLRIIVDATNVDRLVVTTDRIEIGTRVLQAKNQLKKAIVKAWLYQQVSADIAGSFLKLEVASDVLLAMLDGGLDLAVPIGNSALTFGSEAKPWWSFADSDAGVCKSEWRSTELANLCETAADEDSTRASSQLISALSFRPFLGTQIWRSYLATSPSKRIDFTKSWIDSLSATPSSISASSQSVPVESVNPQKQDWVAQIKAEMDSLLPSSLDPLASERLKWESSFDAPLVVINHEGLLSAPGTLKIATPEIQIRRAKLAMMTACEAPTLREVLEIPVEADRIVWRPECTEPTEDFVQVRPSSVRLAISRGLAKPSDRLDTFVEKNADVSSNDTDWLGLRHPRWDEVKQAFRVQGAIEAVEWYRLSRKRI